MADAAGAVRRTPRPALLPRLAELAEQAGKLRTAEWVRTCALLPMEEWPPAPAYKGPVVPAADLDLAVWLHAELQHKLTLPCGECHPCLNWADETWRRAGRKPPTVGRWEDKLAETRGLYSRLDDAIKLIEEMSDHIRQDPALAIGVETRLAALRSDPPATPQRCADCADEPDGPCPMCAVALYGTAGARAYLDARAERDGLQARLARVEALCAEWETNPAADWTAGDAAEHVRAALQGDQPAERLQPTPPPPPARGAIGRWLFQGYDQLRQPVWAWKPGPVEPTGEADRG